MMGVFYVAGVGEPRTGQGQAPHKAGVNIPLPGLI